MKLKPLAPLIKPQPVSRDVTLSEATMLVFGKRGISAKQDGDALLFILYDNDKVIETTPGKKSPSEYFKCRVPITAIPPETLLKLNELRNTTPQHEFKTEQGIAQVSEIDTETEFQVVVDAILNGKITADTRTERLRRIRKLLDTGYTVSIVDDLPNKRWLMLFHKKREDGLNSGAKLWLNDSEMPDAPEVATWRNAHQALANVISTLASSTTAGPAVGSQGATT